MKKQHFAVLIKASVLPIIITFFSWFFLMDFFALQENKLFNPFFIIALSISVLLFIYKLYLGLTAKFSVDENNIVFKRSFLSKKLITIPRDKITAFCISRSPLDYLCKSKTITFKSGNISSYYKGIKITVSKESYKELENDDECKNFEQIKHFNLFLCGFLRPTTFLNLFVVWFPLLWAGILYVFTSAAKGQNIFNISVISTALAFSIGTIGNIILFFVKYYKYRIFRKKDYLIANYGMIIKYKYYLKTDKISAIIVRQNIIMRVLGLRSLEIYIVGFSKAHNYLFPACGKHRAGKIVEKLLPEYTYETLKILPPKKAVWYYLTMPVAICLATLIFLFMYPKILGLKITFATISAILLLFIVYRFITLTTNKYSLTEGSFIFSKGSLSKRTYIINKKNIEAVKESTTFFKARKKLSKGEIYLHANESNTKIKTGLFDYNLVTSLIYKNQPYALRKEISDKIKKNNRKV